MTVAPRPIVPGAGTRPVTTREDVLAVLPPELVTEELAPVRDRLADALASMLAEYEYRSEISAALADVLRATRTYLSVLGEDYGIPRQPDEADDDYRERVLIPAGVASETAIIAGVNAILSLVTDKQCRLLDAQLDQWFLRSSVHMTAGPISTWQSFPGESPRYPDRLYEADAEFNGGAFRPNSTPTGAHLFSASGPGAAVAEGSQVGRKFLLLLPDLLGRDADSAYTASADSPLWAGLGFWVSKASNPTQMRSYMRRLSDTAFAVYRAIESLVQSIAGQSVRFVAIGEL